MKELKMLEKIIDLCRSLDEPTECYHHGAIGKYCIVRTYSAGVYVGKVSEVDKHRNVKLTGSRMIYSWSGALSTLDIARNGVDDSSKLTNKVDEIYLEYIALIPIDEKIRKQLMDMEAYEVR